MTEDERPGSPADSGHVESASVAPPDTAAPDAGAARSRRQALREKETTAIQRVKTGNLATMWSDLNAVDFMNSALQSSALILICLFPFLLVVDAAAGGNVAHAITIRLGLNAQAAKDVDGLISSGHQAVGALTVVGGIVLVLFAAAIPGILQLWYQRLFDVTPSPGGKRQAIIRLVWIAGLLCYIWLQVLAGRQVGPAGGHVIIFVLELVIATLFWWWSMHFLLLGSRSWRLLFPGALATALCLTGLAVVSSLLFSQSITSDDKSYGPIGVVMVLLEYCIGYGVCLHLGAVVGRMWNDHHTPAQEMT
jgi:membrane protein